MSIDKYVTCYIVHIGKAVECDKGIRKNKSDFERTIGISTVRIAIKLNKGKGSSIRDEKKENHGQNGGNGDSLFEFPSA